MKTCWASKFILWSLLNDICLYYSCVLSYGQSLCYLTGDVLVVDQTLKTTSVFIPAYDYIKLCFIGLLLVLYMLLMNIKREISGQKCIKWTNCRVQVWQCWLFTSVWFIISRQQHLSWQVKYAAVTYVDILGCERVVKNKKWHSNMKCEKGHRKDLLTVSKIHVLRCYSIPSPGKLFWAPSVSAWFEKCNTSPSHPFSVNPLASLLLYCFFCCSLLVQFIVLSDLRSVPIFPFLPFA